MDHAEALELLEIAAVEPGGFERLAAGDTIDAAAVAGHVAGCSECAAEMELLRHESALVRDAVRSLPALDLRDRTLAFVEAVGRPRPALAVGGSEQPGPRLVLADADSRSAPMGRLAGGGVRRAGLWAASIAAAVVLAIVGTALVIGRADESGPPDQVAALSRVATWTVRIDAEPDARHVALVATVAAPGPMSGTLIFSPGTKELVVLAEGLPRPPAGQEYRCWMEFDSERIRIGRMFFAGDVALWVGDVPALGDAMSDDVTFGVTLVPAAGEAVDGDPVLYGEL